MKKLLLKKHPELAGFINEPDCELFELEIKNVIKQNYKEVYGISRT